MSFNCSVICIFPVAMRFEDCSDPNQRWAVFLEEFLASESQALNYQRPLFDELRGMQVRFEETDECCVADEKTGVENYVAAYTPSFRVRSAQADNNFWRGRRANEVDHVFYEFLRLNNPLTRWNTPYVVYEDVRSEYDDFFVSGIRFLGDGLYALIRDNTQFDVSFSYDSQCWETKPFQIETDILSSSMSTRVFEEI